MRIATMDEVEIGTIVDVFNRGFNDYLIPVSMDEIVLKDYVFVNDISLKDSFVAFDDSGNPQAFTFTGIRERKGWIGGLAVDPRFRGLGFGRAILKAQIGRVKELGLEELWLECIDQNVPGVRMYEKAGFKRLYDIWFMQLDDPRPIDIKCPDYEKRLVDIADVLPYYDKDHIWPKAARSLRRLSNAHVELALSREEVEAYLIAFPGIQSTYLWDMSPNRFGEALLGDLIGYVGMRQISIANMHNKTLLSILKRWGFIITFTLHVMRLRLRPGR